MDDAHNSAVGTSTHHHRQHNIDMDDDNNNDSTDAVNHKKRQISIITIWTIADHWNAAIPTPCEWTSQKSNIE